MPRHPDMPHHSEATVGKLNLLNQLKEVDDDKNARGRVLQMENDFRSKISAHVDSLPTQDAEFSEFNTSPLVLMMHSFNHGYSKISEIEHDILPAKQFSSMETSAGRMVEKVTLPRYGWKCIDDSKMHSAFSAIDGLTLDGSTLKLATLKSGPRCLNDEMSENFADTIIEYCEEWAEEYDVDEIHFTYGVLYGTEKQSNKKDWHILRNLDDKIPSLMKEKPVNKWRCSFSKNNIDVHVDIQIGIDWWKYLGGQTGFMEVAIALIRSCIETEAMDTSDYDYTIVDLDQIVSLEVVPKNFNVSILQRSQIPWLFFLARHFADSIEKGSQSVSLNLYQN